MNSKVLRIQLYTIFSVAVCMLSLPAHAAVYFQDGFETANMSKSDTDGFKWNANNSTSVVMQSPSDGPTAVYNNGVIYNSQPATLNNGVTRDWTAKDGTYSLRFRYAAGANWSEQRYDLGGSYPDLWVAYWIRVPQNYVRGSGTNNKWFDILMGPMTDYGTTTVSRIEMQDWPNGSGGFNINIQFRNGTDGKYVNSNTYNNFVTPADAGRWMHVVYHLKASSSNSTNDGVLQMYRRWASESTYTLINDLSKINVGIGAGSIASGRPGWAAGYLMGYANAPYANDTEWLIDDFTISTSSLLANVKMPNPPKPK